MARTPLGPDRRELGSALRELTRSAGFTGAAVAEHLGVHPATVSNMMSGKRGIVRDILEEWLDLCRVPADRKEELLDKHRLMASPESSRELGPALQEVMVSAGLSDRVVAHRLGIDRSTVSRIMSGERGILRTTFEKWLDLCRVPADRQHELLAEFVKTSTCPAQRNRRAAPPPIEGPLGPPTPNPHILSEHPPGPGRPRWLIVAEEIDRVTRHALIDPDHPWTLRWPSTSEMATELGVERWTVMDAVHHLGKKGVLVKAWVPRSGGPAELWVPRHRALGLRAQGLGSRPTLHGVAAEIVRRGVSGEWAVLPAQPKLAEHFHVSTKFIVRVMRLVAERKQAVKVRIDGRYRWRIIQPHKVRQIDPRSTAPAARVVVVQVIARIRAGEFRYRLPDGSVHNRPFLSYIEFREQYGVRAETIAKVRAELHHLGWIGPAERGLWQLADKVPPVERATHPAARQQRTRKPPPRKRVSELSTDLITRIRIGRFTGRPFPTQSEVMAEYRAGRRTVVAALEELERTGWIVFQDAPHGQAGRSAVLADPLPEQPRQATPLHWVGLTTRTLNTLLRQGITTVEDFLERSDEDLLSVPNFGVRSLQEVKHKLGLSRHAAKRRREYIRAAA